jgi:hypothetical protein
MSVSSSHLTRDTAYSVHAMQEVPHPPPLNAGLDSDCHERGRMAFSREHAVTSDLIRGGGGTLLF